MVWHNLLYYYNISYKNHLLTKPVHCLLIFENLSSHVMEKKSDEKNHTVSDIKEDPYDKSLQILDN